MCDKTRVLTMDKDKQGILINGMIFFRNELLEQDKPVEDVNEVIDDLINAPTKKEKRKMERAER